MTFGLSLGEIERVTERAEYLGEAHSRRGLPYLLAGKAGGQLSTGRFLEYMGNPHNELYASFLNMLGVPSTGFGEPDFPGTLSGLV